MALSPYASYGFGYSITTSNAEKKSRTVSGLNVSNSATGQDMAEVETTGKSFLSLLYGAGAFSTLNPSFNSVTKTQKEAV